MGIHTDSSKDISVFGNITQRERETFSDRAREIEKTALALDERFKPQFQRREFTYRRPKQAMSYLPEGLRGDGNIYKDRTVSLSYNFWPAKQGLETAETVFCLAGIYNTARRFDFLAEKLSETMNVVALDYPGKGHSGNLWMPHDYRLDTYADLTRQWIDAVAPDGRFHLVGHSHGAKVIYAMVEQGFEHPGWASTVIGDMPPETPEAPKLRRAWRNLERPVYPTVEFAVDRLQNFLAGHGAPVDRDFIVHDFNHGFARSPRDGYSWAYDQNSMQGYCDEYLQPYDKWVGFKSIPTPVLILHGEKSNTATPDLMGRMLETRPDASVFTYEGVGHYPELVTPRRAEEVGHWMKAAGEGMSPVRGWVPADPGTDMVVFNGGTQLQNQPPAAPSAPPPSSGTRSSNSAPPSLIGVRK